jgi:hypothetical protein
MNRSIKYRRQCDRNTREVSPRSLLNETLPSLENLTRDDALIVARIEARDAVRTILFVAQMERFQQSELINRSNFQNMSLHDLNSVVRN